MELFFMCTVQSSGNTIEVVGALLVRLFFFSEKSGIGVSLLWHDSLPITLKRCLVFKQKQPWWPVWARAAIPAKHTSSPNPSGQRWPLGGKPDAFPSWMTLLLKGGWEDGNSICRVAGITWYHVVCSCGDPCLRTVKPKWSRWQEDISSY